MSSSSARGNPKLSVAVVARNAEEVVAATLDSIRDMADEIVVLDAGSTDATAAFARSRATVVATSSWKDDWSVAKNDCLDLCSGDWVLWLEPGETIDRADADSLRRFLDEEAEADVVYYLETLTPADDGRGIGSQIAQPRLHPRKDGLRFCYRVRESLAPAMERLSLAVGGAPWPIRKSPREHDTLVQVRRARQNLALAQWAIEDHGRLPRFLNCQAESHQTLGHADEAIELYRQSLAIAPAGGWEMLEAYCGMLAAFEGKSNANDLQVALALEALDLYPVDGQLLCALGGYLARRGMWELAARTYETAAEFGQLQPELPHLADFHGGVTSCRANVLVHTGQVAEAKRLLETEFAARPESDWLRRQLLELYVGEGRTDSALSLLVGWPAIASVRDALRLAVRGSCAAARGEWEAALDPLMASFAAGCRDPIALRWLAKTLHRHGDRTRLAAVLELWRAVEPDHSELDAIATDLATARSPLAWESNPDLRADMAEDSIPSKTNRPARSPLAQWRAGRGK